MPRQTTAKRNGCRHRTVGYSLPKGHLWLGGITAQTGRVPSYNGVDCLPAPLRTLQPEPTFMIRSLIALTVLLVPVSQTLALDLFDRHTSFWLRQSVKDVKPVQTFSSGDGAQLDALGPGFTSPCVVIRTNDGNLAKALVAWGFRKSEKGLVPVVLLERYVTFDKDRPDVALSAGQNVMLFPGFHFNLDIGQVVPADQGADLLFDDQRQLAAVGEATLHPLNGSAVPGSGGESDDPLDHEGVLPRDFGGTWDVDADGRWRGVWKLTVDDEGNISGQHQSAETKSVYPLRGKVGSVPHRASIEIEFANATQAYDIYLWTKDKSALAGTTSLVGRTFGIYGTRMSEDEKKSVDKP